MILDKEIFAVCCVGPRSQFTCTCSLNEDSIHSMAYLGASRHSANLLAINTVPQPKAEVPISLNQPSFASQFTQVLDYASFAPIMVE